MKMSISRKVIISEIIQKRWKNKIRLVAKTIRKTIENDVIVKGFKFKFMHFLDTVQKHWKIMHFRVSGALVKQIKNKWKTWESEKTQI